ncbi:MAG: asparaginase domain-containing protein [Acidimicrobiia bacterium]|nr:asparaginase domain-containing protein [Acidimicrobiia bacterium]
MTTFELSLISTGGTIEKTYETQSGTLSNAVSVLDHMLAQVRIPDLRIERVHLMNKDSLDMTGADHDLIAATAYEHALSADGVVVVHGTDRLAVSGEATNALGTPGGPIVFTGAMRPYELRDTDALQNLIEALLAVRLIDPGVYVAMHNRVLRFPGVIKDLEAGTFVGGLSG